MFHRFSAAPSKARSQSKASGSARTTQRSKNTNSSAEYDPITKATAPPLAKRRKITRACDRCRQLRIKCDERKPCTHCVGIREKCTMTHATHLPSQANDGDSDFAVYQPSSVLSPSRPSPSQMNMGQASLPAVSSPPDSAHSGYENRVSHDNVFESEHTGLHASALNGCLFPQLPHPALPSADDLLASKTLSTSQRNYYLRLFWDACNPLLQIMSEAEFTELSAPPSTNIFNEYSARSALIDSMIALGIQHSNHTGLVGRILGLQDHASSSPDTNWPGFEFFHRCRECMRTNKDMTLDTLRCHTLMALYLMKGNAFHEAYNLLGITVRKAYLAKLHRLPPSHLPEADRTARMQLWWILFSLDLQCSLQLDMPAAIQKSLIKCPFPASNSLARHVSDITHLEKGVNICTYSTRIAELAVIVTDICACVSTEDLVDGNSSNSSAALETHALNLSSALQNLEAWHGQLPPELLLSQYEDNPGYSEIFGFEREMALPRWLQRQVVLLELTYHNAYVLIQRPFIRLRYANSEGASGTITPPESLQPDVELHIISAVKHAIIVVDTVITVCSQSDILYGWPEVLQPLWNATLTIMACVFANSPRSMVPRALTSITQAQSVFGSFSSTCSSTVSAKNTIRSLISNLNNMMALRSCAVANNDPMSWGLFSSLLDEQQMFRNSSENESPSMDLYSSVLLPDFTASTS